MYIEYICYPSTPYIFIYLIIFSNKCKAIIGLVFGYKQKGQLKSLKAFKNMIEQFQLSFNSDHFPRNLSILFPHSKDLD